MPKHTVSDAMVREVFALHKAGRLAEAVALLDRLLLVQPDNAPAWNNRGNMLLEIGRLKEAAHSYGRAIALKPDYAEALHNRAVARMLAADHYGAESDLDRALQLKPDFAEALEHRGITQARLGRYGEALLSYNRALARQPSASLLCRRADALLRLNRPQDALSDYDRAVSLDRGNAGAWHDRGVVLSRLGRLNEALESYRVALELKPDFADAWHNRGSTLLALQNDAEALACYDKALVLAPHHIEALRNRASLLNRLQRHADALSDFDRAISVRRDDAAAWLGRGYALARLNHEEEALASFNEALRLRPADSLSLYNRAGVYSGLKRYEEAARDVEALLAVEPNFPFARGLLMHVRLHVCDWRGLAEARQTIVAAVRAGSRVIHPFGFLAISNSLDDQLQCARILARESYPAAPAPPLYRGERYRHGKIRLAYLSSDFYQHAIPFLIAGVFEHHDRERFETFGISFGPNDNSEMRRRLEKSFMHFFDVREENDLKAAAMLRDLEIDIAIDLKGYTGGARPGILACRPAPIQVSYLGYPGTMGADYIDYLIADRIVVLDEHRAHYSEGIVYLPDTYQCNDSHRRIAAHAVARSDANLPEKTFVFCCFNGNHKIMPETFGIWMNLLLKAEGSVLWLLEGHPSAAANLRHEAQAKGVAAERLIFAKRLPLQDHLARLKLADLVLDTLPYGAHTTASDALWAGVPVLTRMGETFAGRVAASLLNAIGLPELITYSPAQYESRARELARNAPLLAGIRAKLAKNRETMPLFDTPLITRNLEAAYIEMWNRHQCGE